MGDALQLFEQLDSAHRKGRDDGLEKLLGQKAVQEDTSLATDLAASDLEWRWRRFVGPKPVWGTPLQEYPLCAAIDQAATLQAAGVQIAAEQFAQLVSAEWFAWNVWGVPPDVDEFLSHYKLDVSHRFVLVMQLDEILPWGVVVSLTPEPVFVAFQNDRIWMGRQRGNELDPPHYDPQSQKLIIAQAGQVRVSRKQFLVERIALERIRVTNIGANRCRVDSATRLEQGEDTVMCLPLRMAVQGTRVYLGLRGRA